MSFPHPAYPAQPGYAFDYRSPQSANAHHYYSSPRYSVFQANPSPRGSPKTHTRRASHFEGSSAYQYSARVPPGHSSPSARYFTPQQSTPLRNPDNVPQYTERSEKEPTPKANQSRARRASTSYANARPTSSHQQQQQPPPPKPKPAKEKPAPRKATEEDARRAGIPAGYSYKNWDPNEEPITLLGSVFDANSLGKWIYDWTAFSYGPATPMTDIAGDLWLLLIQLAGKVKRADETIDKVRQEESRELIEEFLESGERLWVRFKKLLKLCEEYMWKAAKKESGERKPVSMGKNSGIEFVDSIFGRDRELEKTEKLMSAIRLWSMRFDANCNDILKNPAA